MFTKEAIMLFCDQCGAKHNFESFGQTKGECDICHQRIGTMNIMDTSYINKLKDVDPNIFEIAGIKVRQIESIIPHQQISALHTDMIHKRINTDKLLFINSNKVIILNETTGSQVEISL
jgi:tRNA G26 N,N-dimethylase Trm1